MGIQWTQMLAVGDPTIDKQHQELFERINRLLEACSVGKGVEEVKETIRFLGDYVVTHFQTEEKMMRETNYPDYLKHKAAHDKFVESLSELNESIQQEGGNVKTVIVTNRLVISWLNTHIMNVDKQFGKFLSERKQ